MDNNIYEVETPLGGKRAALLLALEENSLVRRRQKELALSVTLGTETHTFVVPFDEFYKWCNGKRAESSLHYHGMFSFSLRTINGSLRLIIEIGVDDEMFRLARPSNRDVGRYTHWEEYTFPLEAALEELTRLKNVTFGGGIVGG